MSLAFSRNTIIAQLGRTGSKWLSQLLDRIGLPTFHEPIGGWQEGQFDRSYPWATFIETRYQCRPSNDERDPAKIHNPFPGDAQQLIEQSRYIEVGFSSLPFIENAPLSWRVIGVVRHPHDWIISAMARDFFREGMMSWHPTTSLDYARCWMMFNKRIAERADRIFRLEDLSEHPEMIAQHCGYFRPLTEEERQPYDEPPPAWHTEKMKQQLRDEVTPTAYWDIVQPLAVYFDYHPEFGKESERSDNGSLLSR